MNPHDEFLEEWADKMTGCLFWLAGAAVVAGVVWYAMLCLTAPAQDAAGERANRIAVIEGAEKNFPTNNKENAE